MTIDILNNIELFIIVIDNTNFTIKISMVKKNFFLLKQCFKCIGL